MLGMSILGGLTGLSNFFAAKQQAKAQKDIEQMRIAEAQRSQNQDVALKESALDPFRQQMAQARNLSMLDMRGATQPTQFYNPIQPGQTRQAPAPSYTPSPELLNWLTMLKQNVAGGQNQAPTMTNPANYGKTSALDLLALAQDPSQAGYARGANFAPPPTTTRLPSRRRDEMV